MFWRPGIALWVGTIESLLALSLLIVTMGARVMTLSQQMLDSGTGWVTTSEIVNSIIVGGACWLSWMRGFGLLHRRSGAA